MLALGVLPLVGSRCRLAPSLKNSCPRIFWCVEMGEEADVPFQVPALDSIIGEESENMNWDMGPRGAPSVHNGHDEKARGQTRGAQLSLEQEGF